MVQTRNSGDSQPENPGQIATTVTMDGAQLLGAFQSLIDSQREQTTLLRDSLSEALRTKETPSARTGTARDFKSLGPLDFYGTEGILYADEWLESVERLLQIARVPEDLKVEAASMQLFDIARTWYRDEPQMSAPGLSWAAFKELFKLKFFPAVSKEVLERQFERLEQGDLSVDEYTAEFSRLSHFAEYMVSTPEARAQRYKRGLCQEICLAVTTSRATTYEEILTVALGVERDMVPRQKRDRDVGTSSFTPSKRPFPQPLQQRAPPRPQPLPPRVPAPQRPRVPLLRAPAPQLLLQQRPQGQIQQTPSCAFCRKLGHTWEDCRMRRGVCLSCGSAAHQLRDCPTAPNRAANQRALVPARPSAVQQRGPLPTQQQRFAQHLQQRGGPQQGRAFAMTLEEAEAASDVITGHSHHTPPVELLCSSSFSATGAFQGDEEEEYPSTYYTQEEPVEPFVEEPFASEVAPTED